MKKVLICAPFIGDEAECSQQAKDYTQYALQCGTAPVVPYYFSLRKEEKYRNLCDSAEQSILWFCDELWIIGEEKTSQMQKLIQFCKNLNIPVCYVAQEEITKKLGGNI